MGGDITTPVKKLGARVTRLVSTIYQAPSDGFVTYSFVGGGGSQVVELRSDGSNPPTTVIFHTYGDWGVGNIGQEGAIKKNDYWTVVLAGGSLVLNLRWIPLEP